MDQKEGDLSPTNRVYLLIALLGLLFVIVGIVLIANIESVSDDAKKVRDIIFAVLSVISGFFFILFGVVSTVTLRRIGVKNLNELVDKGMFCIYCRTVVVIPDSTFCPNCGESLPRELADISYLEMRRRIVVGEYKVAERKGGSTCMVCNKKMYTTDLLSWCPYCGSGAHKNHLLESLRVDNHCPACKRLLDEETLVGQLEKRREMRRSVERKVVVPGEKERKMIRTMLFEHRIELAARGIVAFVLGAILIGLGVLIFASPSAAEVGKLIAGLVVVILGVISAGIGVFVSKKGSSSKKP